MAQDNLTPEEKLLKIIENPQTERRKSPGANIGRGAGPKRGTGTGVGAWLNKYRIDKNTIKNISLKTISKMVLALCLVFTIFFIIDFIRMGRNSAKKFSKLVAEAASLDIKDKKMPIKDVSLIEAINLSKRHNVFSFLPATAAGVTHASTMPLEVEQLITNLKLVGIIWSNKPQAIIENAKEQKTYLLNAGDKLKILDVKKVLRDSIILGKDNQEWELR